MSSLPLALARIEMTKIAAPTEAPFHNIIGSEQICTKSNAVAGSAALVKKIISMWMTSYSMPIPRP